MMQAKTKQDVTVADREDKGSRERRGPSNRRDTAVREVWLKPDDP